MTEQEMAQALAQREDYPDAKTATQKLAEAPSQKERYLMLGTAALKEVVADPTATVRRRLWAGLSFFFGEAFLKDPQGWVDHLRNSTPSQTADLKPVPREEEPAMPSWLSDSVPVIFYGSLLGMLLLGVLGWRWTYGWRAEGRLLALATIFIPLPYLLSHAETLVGPRLPLDGVFLTFAAFAIGCLVPGVGLSLFRGSQAGEEIDRVDRRLAEGKRYGTY
jgi:hypothetical protein